KFSNRPEIEHRVERSNFQSADVRHAEEVADMADRRLRQPAAVLFLCAPEQRDDRRLLTAFRIFGNFLLRPGEILFVEREILRLHFRWSKAANAHRSTSPNTISIDPRMADTSASMWPRQRKSMACRCAKPGARILHLYGLLVSSATRQTPNSPFGA